MFSTSTAIMTNLTSFVKNSFLTEKFNQTEHFKKLVWQKSFLVDVKRKRMNEENIILECFILQL
jgi:hypothetical protein